MKLLNGRELAGFIKERQAKAVRALRQAQGIVPKLAIVYTKDDPVINTYMRLKKAYGADILVEVETHFVEVGKAKELIDSLNNDVSVQAIIVQLPLSDPSRTAEIVNLVDPSKDVDALSDVNTPPLVQPVNVTDSVYFEAATPMAIMWLLAGYNVQLEGKKILLIGRGKLVGAPLERILKSMGMDVQVADRSTEDLSAATQAADIIITATGSPAILYPNMIKHGAVIVDAGVASEDGKTVGDVHESMYEREDLIITPAKGGVGPLTVCALFENVIIAAKNAANNGTKHE